VIDYAEEHVVMKAGKPRAVSLATVTPQYYEVFGIAPLFGRYFRSEDARPNATPSLVISEKMWREDFDADPRVVGSVIRLEDSPFRVVGIAPARLDAPGVEQAHYDAWRVVNESTQSAPFNRSSHFFSGIALLKAGVSPTQADADLNRVFAALRARYPETDRQFGIGIRTLLDDVVGDVRPTFATIAIAVLGVLAIACANVASLLLGRANAREREIVIRLALGATRGRIVARVLTESLVFAMLGGALGIGLALVVVHAFVAAAPSFVPRLSEVRIDAATVLFTFAVIALSAALSGIIPALSFANRRTFAALRTSGRTRDSARGARGRAALVVFEVACALALVFQAGLVTRSYAALTARPLGFDPRDVLTTSFIETSGSRYPTEAAHARFYERTRERVRAIPGVSAVAWAFGGPFLNTQWNQSIQIVGSEVPPAQAPEGRVNPVDPDYFTILHVPLRIGRSFSEYDRVGSRPVAIVNDAFAKALLKNHNPIGAQILLDDGTTKTNRTIVTIVGVAADTRDTFVSVPKPTLFRPILQATPYIATLLIRANENSTLGDAVDSAIAGVDARLVAPDLEPLRAKMVRSAARTRATMQTLGALAFVALALALAGIFAIVSYGVSLRTQEFGIRMALGSPRSRILGGVVGRAMRLALAGIALGVVFAAFATRALAITLYDVTPLDPLTCGSVAVLVTAAALVAALVPAWRATRVDPVVALRYE
jgi:putative ABC transport system permease protein